MTSIREVHACRAGFDQGIVHIPQISQRKSAFRVDNSRDSPRL